MVIEPFHVIVHQIFRIPEWETGRWGGNLLFFFTPFCVTCCSNNIAQGQVKSYKCSIYSKTLVVGCLVYL